MLPPELQTIVANFKDNIENYKNSAYNETQLRREFLDKFIKILGWDVDNEAGNHEYYKEVIHEDKLKIGSSTRAPDYCIQTGSRKLFYIEAKKPAVNIKEAGDAAYQVRNYGWNSQMPVCLLTDFEEFSVYNTSVKPKITDKPATARIFYCRYDELDKQNPQYTEYETNWDYLNSLFSKTAVLKGSLEKIKGIEKKGTQEVDKEFLKDIEKWRELLTNNVILRNEITERELNYAVQKIIDRIIFLRICEDRGIEAKNTLQNIAKYKDIYISLKDLFRRADQKYNSGLFHFNKNDGYADTLDTITLKLTIDDKPLKDIIRSLYDPAPYIFSVMPADILGSIYERFLGKVIRLTSAHRAKIEEKPEVKKAGGVYYTPQYIVNYIVENTIGKQLENKTPKSLTGFRVLDPACGSGSFLINAYQFLLDWYLKEYLKKAEIYCKQKILVKTDTDSFKLSVKERKRILTSHIFGVDIDLQAVEVTKLSLLLKALEGLHEQEIKSQLLNERILPNLGNNIKCGNSLVGTDFYAQGTLDFSTEEQIKINCFDWKNEFPEIFKDGGFDCVIGNPPYVLIQTIDDKMQFNYLSKNYKSATYKIDTYQIFTEKALQVSKIGGFVGFIIPNTFLRNKFSQNIRSIILQQSFIHNLRLFYYSVFSASVDTLIICTQKSNTESKEHVVEVTKCSKIGSEPQKILCSQNLWLKNENFEIEIFDNIGNNNIVKKIQSSSNPFGNYGTAYFGIQTHDREKYVSSEQKSENWKPVIDGRNIHNFFFDKHNEYVCCEKQAIKSGGNEDVYNKERICTRQIGETPIATIIPSGIYTLNTVYNIYLDKKTDYSIKFILGVMMSSAFKFYWKIKNFDEKKTFPKIKKESLMNIPIPNLDLSKKSDKEKHDKLVSYVERMLDLKKKEQEEVNPQAKNLITRQISGLENEIDKAVYELYGLSEEEVKVVERGYGEK